MFAFPNSRIPVYDFVNTGEGTFFKDLGRFEVEIDFATYSFLESKLQGWMDIVAYRDAV